MNIPPVKAPANEPFTQKPNLFTTLQHGDADLELEYMMAVASNSGIYLQGRYEVQLADSWNIHTPSIADNGSVYSRWDESRNEGYDGHTARQNASRAPGLWQHLKISFLAPRFATTTSGAAPHKIANARLARVELNGILIHEDVELSGPTRGAAFGNEQAIGPLLFQGDHGAVAFRNIRYTTYDKVRPELLNLTYAVYKGRYQREPKYDTLKPVTAGTVATLSASVSRIPNEFMIHYTGTLRVAEPGEYQFTLDGAGGTGGLKINNQVVVTPSETSANRGSARLPKGDLPVDLFYAKFIGGTQSGLSVAVAGSGIRAFTLGDEVGGITDEVDPITVDASTNTILRSFVDLPPTNSSGNINRQSSPVQVVHAVSVGSPEQVHYTYDLDKGAVVQVWRGLFLDTTPMWHERGNGVARPMGMVNGLGDPVLFLAQLVSPQTEWPSDTTGSGYRPKGYRLDESDRPTFRYQSYGSAVTDKIRVWESGKGIQREVVITNLQANLYARLACGTTISPAGDGLYLVDGQEYVRVDDASGSKPIIRQSGGRQELIVPVTGGKLTYSILF